MDNQQPKLSNNAVHFDGTTIVINVLPLTDKKFLRLLGKHETQASVLREAGDTEGALKQIADCAFRVVEEAQRRQHFGQTELPTALAVFPRFQCAYQTGIEIYKANQALFVESKTQTDEDDD